MQALIVSEDGVKLTYVDSGAPEALSDTAYTTVFAVHGIVFNANIWKRLSEIAGTANLRFVAINRRPYGGSTPYTPEELALIEGSDEEKLKFFTDRGVELATFVDCFIQNFDIPPISADGKGGGLAFLPWSAGHGPVISALVNVNSLPEAARTRFASYVRTMIMYDPPSHVLGVTIPPALIWSPLHDPSTPDRLKMHMTSSWVSSYFNYGDLSMRNMDVLSSFVPSSSRAPSIYNIATEEAAITVDDISGALDWRLVAAVEAQASLFYRKACFDKETRALIPNMRIRVIYGEKALPYCIAGAWSMQEDDEAHGGGFIEARMVPGVNHFMQWDDAELALKVIREAVDGV